MFTDIGGRKWVGLMSSLIIVIWYNVIILTLNYVFYKIKQKAISIKNKKANRNKFDFMSSW